PAGGRRRRRVRGPRRGPGPRAVRFRRAPLAHVRRHALELPVARPPGWYAGGLRAHDADGREIFDHLAPSAYRSIIREESRPWTYMKFPYLAQLGPDLGWYRVGPLARINVCSFIDTP